MTTVTRSVSKVLFQILKVLLTVGYVLSIPSILVWVPLLLAAILLAKVFRPDLGPIVTGTSLVFMGIPAENHPTNLVHLLVLDRDISRTEFLKLFHTRVVECRRPNGRLMFPHLRDTWTEYLFHTFWKPERGFSTEKHIADFEPDMGLLTLPSPRTPSDLEEILGPFTAKPWPPGSSPWEIMLVHDYRPTTESRNRATVIVFRHHHALIDGYGLVSLIRALTQRKFELPSPQFPKIPFWVKVVAALKVPYSMIEELVELSPRIRWKVPLVLGTAPDLISSFSTPILVDEIKVIKGQLRVSYAAVILGIAAAALYRALEEEGVDVPHSVDVWSPNPLPNHPGGTVNHVVSLKTPWKIKGLTTVERIHDIQSAMSKHRQNMVTAHLSTHFKCFTIQLVPTAMRNLIMATATRSGMIMATAFPVTTEKVSLEGRKLEELISTVGPLGDMRLSVVSTGVNGKQRIVATIDKNVLPSGRSFRNFGKFVNNEVKGLLCSS